jgi:hypothetical protein
MSDQIAGGANFLEVGDEARLRPFPVQRDRARYAGKIGAIVFDRFQEQRQTGLAFPFQHAVDLAFTMLQQFLCGERGAMPADEHETSWQEILRCFGQVDDLGHVGQIIQ